MPDDSDDENEIISMHLMKSIYNVIEYYNVCKKLLIQVYYIYNIKIPFATTRIFFSFAKLQIKF